MEFESKLLRDFSVKKTFKRVTITVGYNSYSLPSAEVTVEDGNIITEICKGERGGSFRDSDGVAVVLSWRADNAIVSIDECA